MRNDDSEKIERRKNGDRKNNKLWRKTEQSCNPISVNNWRW